MLFSSTFLFTTQLNILFFSSCTSYCIYCWITIFFFSLLYHLLLHLFIYLFYFHLSICCCFLFGSVNQFSHDIFIEQPTKWTRELNNCRCRWRLFVCIVYAPLFSVYFQQTQQLAFFIYVSLRKFLCSSNNLFIFFGCFDLFSTFLYLNFKPLESV